ncbi:MAG: sugar phosphate isomerase/epimerase [Planctomycetota bacterium]|nr:sugar phosphate isomerase/epimerase [Planctomycetaceae bacterium]MDQ3331454.1 sugar phosphate isomerase/epimerase [Planctomycetota bacterium]
MDRRSFLQAAAVASAASCLPSAVAAAPDPPRFRKSLKWNMVGDKSGSLAESFEKLKACGFEGLEPNLSEVKDPAEWLEASRSTGLHIDCIVSPQLDGIEQAIDLCKRLGGDSILTVARYDVSKPFADNWKRCVEIIRAAAPHAERQGVKILVENVWATFLISALDMQRFIDEIAHPFVGVHYDVGNVVRWGVAEHWVEVLGSRIGKLDVKEYSLPKAMKEGMAKGFDTPLGEGSIKWDAVRSELDKIGLTGWAAAEMRSGDWEYLADVAKRMDKVLGNV